jgi:hypothetical protein
MCGDTPQRVELDVGEPDLGSSGQSGAVELVRANDVAKRAPRMAEVDELPCTSVKVAARLADRKALLEQLDRTLVVSLAQVDAAEVVQGGGEQPAVIHAWGEHQRLLVQRAGLVAIPARRCGHRERVHPRGLSEPQSLRPRELEQSRRPVFALVDVALPERQDRSAPERIDQTLGVDVAAEREGGGQIAPAFGPVPPLSPPKPDRTRQL